MKRISTRISNRHRRGRVLLLNEDTVLWSYLMPSADSQRREVRREVTRWVYHRLRWYREINIAVSRGACMTGVKSSCQGKWRPCESERGNTFLYTQSVHIPLHSWMRSVCTTKWFFLCRSKYSSTESTSTVLCDNKARFQINFLVNKTPKINSIRWDRIEV